MALTLLHCPKCRAMQPNQERCGVCGAMLGGGPEADGDRIPLGEVASLAGVLFLYLGGFVLAAVLLLSLFFWLLR